MITIVCCSCYFDIVLYMKNNSQQVFRNNTSGCLVSAVKISGMREKIERMCHDYIGIEDDSIIIVCSNCFQYQTRLTDQKKFTDSFLQSECFSFKQKSHMFCIDALCEEIISADEMCYGVAFHNVVKYFYFMTLTYSF